MGCALLLVATMASGVVSQESPQVEDPRSRVVLEQLCRNEFSRRQLTLFANGTLRQRDGEGATRTMRLAELGPEKYEAFVNRLRLIRFDDLAPSSEGLSGEWVESCRLEIHLPDADSREFVYGPYDSVAHGLRLALLVVDDLLLEMEDEGPEGARRRSFEVEVGDVLIRRRDSARFEVIGFTVEGTGVELQGLDQPITIFHDRTRIADDFDPSGDEGRR